MGVPESREWVGPGRVLCPCSELSGLARPGAALGRDPGSLTGLPVNGSHGRSSTKRRLPSAVGPVRCLLGLVAPLPQVVGLQESGPV